MSRRSSAGPTPGLGVSSHITGKVTASGGAGIANIAVTAYSNSGNNLWFPAGSGATTAADGTYDIGGLRAGTYRIGFSTYMNGAYIPEYWDDVRTVGAATNIVVGESATVTAKNAELAPASRISGKVTGRDGAGVAEVQCQRLHEAPRPGLLGHRRRRLRLHRTRRDVRDRRTAGRHLPHRLP